MVTPRTFFGRVRDLLGKISPKTMGKKYLLFLGVVVVLFCGAVFVVYRVAIHRNPEPKISCQTVVSGTDQAVAASSGRGDFQKIYDNLTAHKDSCQEKKKILGIGRSDGVDDKLQQIKYYHDKATNGYRLGKEEEAKKDAEKGLSIDAGLKDTDKKLNNYKKMIQDLEWVRDGTF